MKRMTREECWQFLRSPVRTGKVATVRKDGQPLVVPVWYDLEGETIVFMTGRDALKVKSIHRDPRLSMCVDDEVTPFAYVTLEGTATISADADQGLYWATRIGGRYMGQELAEAYGKINSGDWILTVHLTPTNMHGYKELTAKYPQPAQQGRSR